MSKNVLLGLIAAAVVSGCTLEEIPKQALQLSEETTARRKLQTRRFETNDEAALLTAAAALLKNSGFIIDQKSEDLGLLAASKQGSAYNVGEIAGAAAVLVITQVLSFPQSMPFSKDQVLRASVVARLAENESGTSLRVTFQRVVWNTEGRVSDTELVEDPAAYVDFFDKLSLAVDLQAHDF